MLKQSGNALKNGQPVIIFDDGSQTPCGYLLYPAQTISEEKIKLLVNNGKGIILVPLREDLAKEKGLSALTSDTKHPFPMTIGVESRLGVGSGISAADRSKTVSAILETTISNRLIVAPGHIFPLPALKNGLLVKSGIAEACCDLLKIFDFTEIGAISHCLNKSGGFTSYDELLKYSASENTPLIPLSSIIQHRLINEKIVTKVSSARLPTEKYGDFRADCFKSKHDGAEHLVLSKGDLSSNEPVLTRMHSEKKLGDIFSLKNIPERTKLQTSLSKISAENRGVLVYINKAKRNLISEQLEIEKVEPSITVNSDSTEQFEHQGKIVELREFGLGAQILRELGISQIKLLTTEKRVLHNLEAYGITISEQVTLN